MASFGAKNPHAALTKPTQIELTDMSLPFHTRIQKQWNSCCGAPIDDDFKKKFIAKVYCPETKRDKNFVIADIRLWKLADNLNDNSVALEFFFDGCVDELPSQEAFSQAFEKLLEDQIQERRMNEFRNKLTQKNNVSKMRKRNNNSNGASQNASRIGKNENNFQMELLSEASTDIENLEGGSFYENEGGSDESWKNYLKQGLNCFDFLKILNMCLQIFEIHFQKLSFVKKFSVLFFDNVTIRFLKHFCENRLRQHKFENRVIQGRGLCVDLFSGAVED